MSQRVGAYLECEGLLVRDIDNSSNTPPSGSGTAFARHAGQILMPTSQGGHAHTTTPYPRVRY